ncbi:MAG: GNAT family N-acetyltransferase [Lautropia sp.]
MSSDLNPEDATRPATAGSADASYDAADYRMQVVDDPARIAAPDWQRLLAADRADGGAPANPFVDHRFLAALSASGSVGGRTGWLPRIALLERDRQLVAAAPLYEKHHSYGEYVFDWAWADAYQRNGLEYYPKGLVAVPFTPVPGPRLLAVDRAARGALVAGLLQLAGELGWSSLHVLFPDAVDAQALAGHRLLERKGVQFHWHNPGFASFDAFVATLAQPKRKKILAERRKVRDAGIRVDTIEGPAITGRHWDLFDRCYRNTYREHHSTPYLTREFFRNIGAAMPEHLVLFVATPVAGGAPIAASLLFHDAEALYGRYWGSLAYVPCLHFEASYYAPIEWAIARGLKRFEGGAQGEHKMARGFLPVATRSAHWLAHPAFNDAVARFLERETGGVDAYLDELREHSPLRK